MMHNAFEDIPAQHEGTQMDVIHFVDCDSRQQAHELFTLAKSRLKDVSNWQQFCGPGSSKFTITDTQGNDVYKIAEKGDHFYINLPSPGSIAGDGLDWVRIELIDDAEDAHAESEFIAITVRPVANPRHPEKATAHFFKHTATSTFIVERYLNHVSAAVHGRNESPNNTDTNLYDTIRNTIVALTARHGLSGPQWKALVKGLLNDEGGPS
jgi:hypothetical protein